MAALPTRLPAVLGVLRRAAECGAERACPPARCLCRMQARALLAAFVLTARRPERQAARARERAALLRRLRALYAATPPLTLAGMAARRRRVTPSAFPPLAPPG